jgi:hypothetical protein
LLGFVLRGGTRLNVRIKEWVTDDVERTEKGLLCDARKPAEENARDDDVLVNVEAIFFFEGQVACEREINGQ